MACHYQFMNDIKSKEYDFFFRRLYTTQVVSKFRTLQYHDAYPLGVIPLNVEINKSGKANYRVVIALPRAYMYLNHVNNYPAPFFCYVAVLHCLFWARKKSRRTEKKSYDTERSQVCPTSVTSDYN